MYQFIYSKILKNQDFKPRNEDIEEYYIFTFFTWKY